MNILSIIFLILILTDCSLKLYLNSRQQRSINRHYSQVPTPFSQQISLDDHHKAANYNLAKLKLNRYEILMQALLVALFTFGGGIDWLANLTSNLAYPLTSEVMLIVAYSLVSSAIALPFNYYATFKIEQRFGFNKMSLTLFIVDIIKTTLLSCLIGIPLLYLILWVMTSLGASWWLWVWLVLVGFNLLILIIYPTIIAPLFNKFSPLTDTELTNKIQQLLTKCGFKSSGVFVMDGSRRSSHGNAYFTGLGSSKRIVFFDTLLNQLEHSEIIAVLAHELGHFKHKHILKQVILSFTLTLVALYLFSLLSNQLWFYQGLNVHVINHASSLLLGLILISSISLPLAPLTSYLSRKNEFEADDFAKAQTNKQDLITGLVKLYRDNASTLTPDPVYVKFYYSHPPASLRIANLEQ